MPSEIRPKGMSLDLRTALTLFNTLFFSPQNNFMINSNENHKGLR